MRLAHTASWRIGWDVPEELQFSGYVGRHEGYSVAQDTAARTQAEVAWHAWWEALPERLAGVEVDLPEPRTDSPFERLRTLAERRPAIFSPPDFPELRDAPELQERCRRYWPHFAPSWDIVGGVKWTLTSQLDEQIQRVHLNLVVRASIRAAGKHRGAPFALRVDMVQWPDDYRREVPDAHIVLGVRYLEREQVEALREVLRQHITRLV